MAKANITITIDIDLKEYFSASTINLSSLINDFLRGYKDRDTNTVNALNLQIKKKEFAKLTSEVRTLQTEIESYETERENSELQVLKQEK